MGYSPWKLIKLDEIIEINPRISLKKGEVAKKIAMVDIKEFTRKVQHYELTKFTSGSKFQNSDTLMARITPCLENGKTAFMDVLDDNEAAFGSTEFFILRAKERLADPKFIYYLSITEELRSVAIQSMTGTSGRQRAQRESILNYEMRIPPIGIQKKIGEILSILDDKIELNLESISTLERLAQTLFKYWFVDFEFPNENGEPYKSSGGEMVESELGMIPYNWSVGTLDDVAIIGSGKRPKLKSDNRSYEASIPIIGASKIMGYTNEKLFNKPIVVTGRVGTHGVIQRHDYPCWPSDNTLVIESDYLEYVYQFLHTVNFKSLNRGSTQPLITQGDIKSLKLSLAPKEELKKFEKEQATFAKMISNKKVENSKLEVLRNNLLPKLLSGEIEIPDETEVTENVPIS